MKERWHVLSRTRDEVPVRWARIAQLDAREAAELVTDSKLDAIGCGDPGSNGSGFGESLDSGQLLF
jgi:hypothetical protein